MDIDAQQEREYARQEVVARAVAAAYQYILDNSDGTTDEITAEVAVRLFHQAVQPLHAGFHGMTVGGIADSSVRKAEEILRRECIERSDAVRNWMLFLVAFKFIEKVGITYNAQLIRHDLEDPDNDR